MRQIIISVALVIISLSDWIIPGFKDWWCYVGLLLLLPVLFCLKKSQRRFHGAEHMAVNLWEGNEPSVFHPGCGSNLVLLILPVLLLDLLPFPYWVTIGCAGIYILLMIKVIHPKLQRGLRNGNRLSQQWWRLSRRWQRFFVAEPQEEEIGLAIHVLNELIRSSRLPQDLMKRKDENKSSL